MALASGELPPSAPSTQRRAEGAFRPKTPRDPADARRPLGDAEVLFAFDEFLYHGEVRDFVRAQHSFERISSSLGTDDFDSLIPPCLEVLEFSNHFIRNDTLLCLMYISLGCTLCDGPAEALGPAMRGNIAVLARHDAMPMLVRSLDFLLGHDSSQVLEEGMLEREFRLVLNCIYLQLLFHRHEESFIGGLEMGQGRLGASLVSLLFEATKMCSESDKIPIKKVVLLLLAVLRCLLAVPDEALVPSAGAEQATSAAKVGSVSFPDLQDAAALAASAPSKPPRLRDFQAFAALHLHERGVRQKYGTPGRPAAIEEGLAIIQRYEDEFMKSYSFHPSEVTFMQTSDFLQDAHRRYEQFVARGEVAQRLAPTAPAPRLPSRTCGGDAAVAVEGLGTLVGEVGQPQSGAGTEGHERDAAFSDSECGSVSDSSASDASSVATAVGPDRRADDDLSPRERAPPMAGRQPYGAGAGGLPQAHAAAIDPEPLSSDPVAVFQRLYLSIFPCLTETVVLLLRLLLTSCSNVENYPGVVDMARECQVTALGEDEGTSESQFLAFFEKALPEEAVEAQRHREIMAAAVSGIVLILLKQARRAASEQFSSLAQLITDSNGALVVLKFLNQDLSAAMEPRDSLPVLPCLQVAVTAWREPGEGGRPASWPACATLRLLEVLYLLCKDSPERVRKYLIHYKAPFILKRLHRIENHQVQRLVLKLLRKQVRYLPRKWKQTNMKAISAIYTMVPMSPLEDWLLNEPLYERFEGPSQADVRGSNTAYNVALLRSLTTGSAPAAGGQAGSQAAGLTAPPQEGESALHTEAREPHPPDAGLGQPAETFGSSAARSGLARPGQIGKARQAEPIGDEALGYAQLFPEYVPACCS